MRALLRKGGYSVRAAARGELRREDLGTESIPADDVDLLTGASFPSPPLFDAAGAVLIRPCGLIWKNETATADVSGCRGAGLCAGHTEQAALPMRGRRH